jgi:hypothetical protein
MSQPRAIVRVTRRQIEVSCRFGGHQVPLDPKKELRDQISSAVFVHERQCGRCDTSAAHERGSPDFVRNVNVARHVQDRIDEKRAANEAQRIVDE